MRLNFWLKSFLTLRSLPSRHRARRRRSLSVPALASLRGPLSPVSEPLEDRALLTSVISFLDGTLTIDVGADGEQTTLSVSGGTDLSITSSDAGGTTADAAAQALGFTATTAADEVSTGSLNGGSPVTQIVINGASGTQTIVLGDGSFPTVTAGGNSDIELVTVTGDVTLGNNDLQLLATQTVSLTTGAGISTVDGNVTLEANTAGTTNVDAVGISLNNATISTSGTGDISLAGRGGDGTGAENNGVNVAAGSRIESTATGVDAGLITITGTGGTATNFSSGVVFRDAGSTVSTVDGAISITGEGATGTMEANHGVQFIGGATATSTGTGAQAGTITLVGTGGSGTSSNQGVVIHSTDSAITSVDGDISITGQGGAGSEAANIGVFVFSGASIQSTGTTSDAATITISGTGGSGTASNIGVSIHSTDAQVTTVQGDISITGQGGSGTGNGNLGVQLYDGGTVSSTGIGADAPDILITGTGGSGQQYNYGIHIDQDGSAVRAVEGAVLLNGFGGTGSGMHHGGVALNIGGRIESTGSGSGAATISVNGTGGTGSGGSSGIVLYGTGTLITSVDGAIDLAGTGGDGTTGTNGGVWLLDGGRIESTGTTANAANVSITGTGGSGVSANIGVAIHTSGAQVTSVQGDITILGQGGNATGDTNHGVQLLDGGSVCTTGVGLHAPEISITGTGGSGTESNYGVQLDSAGASVSAIDGAVRIDGSGGIGNQVRHLGVSLSNGATIQSTGTGSDAATITVHGTGGAGTGSSAGVVVENSGTAITSIDGAIAIDGTGGGGDGSQNGGVWILDGGHVESTGTTADAATVSIHGTGQGTGGISVGVMVQTAGSAVTSINGDVVVEGAGGPGTTEFNHGVAINNGAVIQSTGPDGNAANIQITGTAGTGTQNNFGITLNGTGSAVTSYTGTIQLTGNDTVGSGVLNRGIAMLLGGLIESTGSSASLSAGNFFRMDPQSQINSALGTTINVDLDSNDSAVGADVYIEGTLASAVQTTITTGDAADSLLLNLAADSDAVVINTGNDNDTVDASDSGVPVTINGGGGDDLLTGSAFDDVLNGEDGNDTLVGLGGLDQLTGGSGTDSFENVVRPLVVDTALDVDDGDYSTGNLSLREAVRLANESVDLDETISFDAALNGQTITLTGGELPILNPVVINGPGATLLTIDAANHSRVFNVDDGDLETEIVVSISGLTLTRGMTTGNGGAIVNSEDLTVTDLTITGSSAMYGGGIYNDGVLAVTGSTLSGNSAESGGGILDEQASLTLTTSTIAENVATFQGAGIRLGRSNAVITDSAILRNTGSGEGGGIASYQSDLTVENSTLFGNETRGDGGGIFVGSGGAAEVVQTTISGNRSGVDNTGVDFKFGGGIRKRSGSLTVRNSIVAGNFRDRGTQPDDITGSVNSGTFNLVGDADSSGGLMDGVDGNIVGDQGVGVLELSGVLEPLPVDHGGPTVTFALPEGSLAIDAGDNAQTPSVNDQRGPGFDRIIDGDGDRTATVDLGSFEFLATPPPGPAAVTLTVPASLELLVQDEFLILRDIQGTEFFRQLESSVTELQINLSDGPDLLRFINVDAPVITPVKVDAGGGNDQVDATLALARVTLVGGSGDDLLTGGAFADVLSGGAGSDTLDGSTGNDFLRGQGGGRDVLVASPGNDKLDGGAGTDLVVQTASGNSQLYNNRISGIGYSEIISIEMAILNGSDDDDSISAEQFRGLVTINGAGGNDRLYGAASGDVINGGDGNDFIVGFAGDDRIDGGNGNDNLVGGAGSDTLIGGEGDDQLRGLGSSGDVLSGGPGADRLDGGKGNDRLVEFGDAGFILTDTSLNDGTSVDELADLESVFLTGGNGGQRLDASGFSGWVKMIGGQGNDTLIGTELGDILFGLGGDDVIEGRAGNDRLRGSAGRDRLSGGVGDDELLGQGSSGDTLRGGEGTDTLDGGAGVDRIFDDGIDVIAVDARDNVLPA